MSTHAHARSPREASKRDIDGPPRRRLLATKVLIQISKSHICLWVAILSSSSSWFSSCARLYMSQSQRVDNTSLAQYLPAHSHLAHSSSCTDWNLLFPITSYYMYRFPANYDRVSIAFFTVSLARAAGPSFAPGNVFTLKGLAPRQ